MRAQNVEDTANFIQFFSPCLIVDNSAIRPDLHGTPDNTTYIG